MKKVSEMGHEKRNVAKHFCFCGKAMIPVVCTICDGCGDDPYRDPSDKYVCGLCDGTGETWRCPDGHTEEINNEQNNPTSEGGDWERIGKQLREDWDFKFLSTPHDSKFYRLWLDNEKALELERRSRQESDAVLCYISRYESRAIFTTAPLGSQWGDDWNDAPYEHNCGDPYEWRPSDKKPPYALYEVYFKTDMETPAQKAWGGNSLYSVEMINNRETPWLSGEGKAPIYAGVSIAEFKRIIKANGGTIFVPEED